MTARIMGERHRRATQRLDDEKRAHRLYAGRIADLRAQGIPLQVIRKREHPEQWAAWLTYFKAKGLNALVDLMDNSQERTVPTWWPHDFDLDVEPTRRHSDD